MNLATAVHRSPLVEEAAKISKEAVIQRTGREDLMSDERCVLAYEDLGAALQNVETTMNIVSSWADSTFSILFWPFEQRRGAEAWVQPDLGRLIINIQVEVADPHTYLHELAHLARGATHDKDAIDSVSAHDWSQSGIFYDALLSPSHRYRWALFRRLVLEGEPLAKASGVDYWDNAAWKDFVICCEIYEIFGQSPPSR